MTLLILLAPLIPRNLAARRGARTAAPVGRSYTGLNALLSPSVTAQTTIHDAIRDLLRAPAPPALGSRGRAPPAQRRLGAGGAGRPARHRLPVGSRAPFPGGVQPFLRAGGVPGGGEPAHQPDPAGPRDRAAP